MSLRYRSVDKRRETKAERAKFGSSIRIENEFARHLRKIAAKVGHLVEQFDPNVQSEMTELEHMLMQYAEMIRPWARAVSRRMLTDVSRKDEREWAKVSRTMSESIRSELRKTSPIGKLLRSLQAEQVDLITSLPREAAQRVHELTLRNVESSKRADDVVKEIMLSGEVTKSRANLIARTEVARTSSLLTEARAHVHRVEGYVWRTSRDQDVRLSHKKMEGKFVRWDSPPTLSDGTVTHAGQIYNCFPGETLVQVPWDHIVKVFRASYVGELVTLFAGETSFDVTPNHPILTPSGWVAAGDLEIGDDLVQVSSEGTHATEYDIDSRFVPIREVFESLASDVKISLSSTEVDFYGDLTHGEVEIVLAKPHLPFELDTMSLDFVREQVITCSDSRVLARNVMRRVSKILEALVSGLGDIGQTLFWSSAIRHQAIALGLSSHLDVRLDDQLSYGGDSCSIPVSQSWSPVSLDVLSDYLGSGEVRTIVVPSNNTLRISKRSTRQFSGHVFTLETVQGHYKVTPAQIIAKNCRCYPEPVIPDDL